MHGHMESSNCSTCPERVTYLSLPWEHVIYRYVMPCLSLKEIFQQRLVCRQFKELVDRYFQLTFLVDISRVPGRMTALAFSIMVDNNRCLRYLTLHNAKDWLCDQLLLPVFENNPHLQKLDLTNCSSLTETSLNAVAVQCPRLRILVLRNCHWVSPTGISMVTVCLPDLEHLDLTGCWDLQDKAIISLVMQCNKLRYLSLSKIYSLTDNAINVVAHCCVGLQHLNIQGCWRITNDSIRLLGAYCQCLEALQVKDCRDINEISLAHLRARGVKIDCRPPPGTQYLMYLSENLHQRHLQI
ncbi:F-box/LRR-repeat protein 15-like [Gigantopelta aegis]|uniref:F-box/LRR-repeat protein 15-like n=1 Tax=Gigantopelta aegis TaxID=1735272 RepID=UPI001B88AEED|nr:F-box/LRR-repeat protein 15-like [Gigantopelta aegis]XP_041363920.1 F-box/LRR-repeat protein 15-like [Gigantopelta aegis]XP_041363921.1 F-box/LRR-repeat protein 15-like [Gigantopelta aegis]